MNNFTQQRFSSVLLTVGIALLVCWSGEILASDVELTWDAPTWSGVAGYKVHYGTGSRTYSTSIDVVNVTSYTITGLPDGTYYFAVTAYDTSRVETAYSNEVSTSISTSGTGGGVGGVVDTTPPTLLNVTSSIITSTGATVSWTTNEPSDTLVEYGTTTLYGNPTGTNPTLVTNHSFALTGLKSWTAYHYRVTSRDAAGNPATSSDYTFTTLKDHLPAPANARLHKGW